ncbi:MAG TPA: hypothetical protein VMG81_04735 [Thermoplasmata archaeon]|nr:hypothetical protein [Thermoplasmata archaeon]
MEGLVHDDASDRAPVAGRGLDRDRCSDELARERFALDARA